MCPKYLNAEHLIIFIINSNDLGSEVIKLASSLTRPKYISTLKPQTEDGSQENKEDLVPSLMTSLSADLHVNSRKWLHGDPKYSFQNWKRCLPKHGELA